jgi:transposase-like protein
MSTAATPEKRAAAVEYYRTHSASETAAAFGVNKSAVSRWAKAAGLDKGAEVRAQTQAATEAHELQAAASRAKLQVKLLQRAHEMLDRMGEKATIYVGSGATPMAVEIERPHASTCKDLALTAAVLIDKLRLEAGEATSRGEVRHEYPDIAALSDDELEAAIVREAESITRGEAEA